MKPRIEWRTAGWLAAAFAACWAMPMEADRFRGGVMEGLALVQWYAREHVILCLVPAFFIAGAVSVFVRRESVMRFLGPEAPKAVAYGVAAVSGSVLAVCSCTVLPLFAGIWRMGAGLGPATAFLYSGPAISALAVILTARILGLELGAARALGAVASSLLLGAAMAWLFRKSEAGRARAPMAADSGPPPRPLWQTTAWLGLMVLLLVAANWSDAAADGPVFRAIAGAKWPLTAACALALAAALAGWFGAPLWKIASAVAATAAGAWLGREHMEIPFVLGGLALAWITSTSQGELGAWWDATWDLTKQIAPLLLGGVFVAGLLLGRPEHEGWIPSAWIAGAVGGESPRAVFLAAIAGAVMYFATLTEIPILQGLIGGGMGRGPALALLLAGPALSLPSMLAIGRILGWRRTAVYVLLVILLASAAGWAFGQAAASPTTAPVSLSPLPTP